MLPIITTEKLDAVRSYYETYFGFEVSFDYPGKFLGMKSTQNEALVISFMAPTEDCRPFSQGASLCFEVDDVDAQCERLTQMGLPIVVPLQDNPWGDRSFISVDPAGVSVYVYKPIEPTDEFKKCMKE